MGTIAYLESQNAALTERVRHLENAFDGMVTLLHKAYERLERIQSGAPIPLGDNKFFIPEAKP